MASVKELIINSNEFWDNLSVVHAILKPMHDAVMIIEADEFPLSCVIEAFERIKECFSQLTGDERIISNLQGIVTRRHAEECTLLKMSANILDPTVRGRSVPVEKRLQAFGFILDHCLHDWRRSDFW